MNFPFFLAKRITLSGQRVFSKLIVRVAIATIAVGMMAMILAIAILNGFKQEIIGKQRGFLGDIVIENPEKNNPYESAPITYFPNRKAYLEKIDNIASISSFALKPVIINVDGEVEGLVLKGIGADYDQSFLQEVLIEGDTLVMQDSAFSEQHILISQYLANRLQLSLDDDFLAYFIQEPVRKRKFVVKGIFNLGVDEFDKSQVIGAMSLVQKLNGWEESQIGGLELRIHDFDQLEYTNFLVDNSLPVEWDALHVRERFPEIFQWLDLLDANPQVILVLMTSVALINMISALLIMILERTQMIGLLKALGASQRRIRSVFLFQAGYLIGLGLLIGNALAGLLYFLQKKYRLLKLDEADYYVSFVPVQIGFQEVFLINLGVIILSFLVLLIPSMLISRINPVKTIHFQ